MNQKYIYEISEALCENHAALMIGAGFSKNAENQHTGQIVCFDDKNS